MVFGLLEVPVSFAERYIRLFGLAYCTHGWSSFNLWNPNTTVRLRLETDSYGSQYYVNSCFVSRSFSVRA